MSPSLTAKLSFEVATDPTSLDTPNCRNPLKGRASVDLPRKQFPGPVDHFCDNARHAPVPNGSMTAPRFQDPTVVYYERHADEYAAATEPISMARFASRFASLLPDNASVLDLGCGSGRDLRVLSNLGLRCTGIDLSEPLATRAARYSGCPVVVGDIRALPFQDGTFTGIWASASLLHLPRADLSHGLAECRRLLGHEGILFASMKSGSGEGYDNHGRWYSYVRQPEWVALLRQARFDVLSARKSSSPGTQDHSWIASFACAEK